jgi:hypothetical protein
MDFTLPSAFSSRAELPASTEETDKNGCFLPPLIATYNEAEGSRSKDVHTKICRRPMKNFKDEVAVVKKHGTDYDSHGSYRFVED